MFLGFTQSSILKSVLLVVYEMVGIKFVIVSIIDHQVFSAIRVVVTAKKRGRNKIFKIWEGEVFGRNIDRWSNLPLLG